jgi:hypothetical protein
MNDKSTDEPEFVVIGAAEFTAVLQPHFPPGELNERKVRYLLDKKIIKAGRMGSQYCSTNRKLLKQLDKLTSGE